MRGLDAGLGYAEIGRQIRRDRITIWREVRRNRNADGDYHARMAHARAARKAHRPKAFKLIDNPVCASVEAWMDDGWSPRLIAQMLARDHPDDRLARVSHETIYSVPVCADPWELRALICINAYPPRGQPANLAAALKTDVAPTAAGRNSGSATARERSPIGPCPDTGKAT